MKRIAVWVDGSEGSKAAVHWAAVLARAAEVPLVVFHALGRRPDARSPADHERLLESCRRSIAGSWTAEAGDIVDTIEPVLCEGDPRDVLLGACAAHGIDLVVVGRTGARGGAGASHLGSVVEHAAHHSSLPLAVVPAGWAATTRRIAVGVDGSAASQGALAWSATAAAALGASLLVVRIDEPMLEWTAADSSERWRERLERQLVDASQSAAQLGVEMVSVTVRDTKPAEGLLGATLARDAQVLVIGTRGLGGFGGFTGPRTGGVTQKLLQRATMPLVVVPVT